jgi:hypothetical protein
MPRGTRNKRGPQRRTIEKAQAGLLEFFQAAGIEVSPEDVQAAYERQYTPREHPDSAMLQAEGVLHILRAPKHFVAKKCLECKEAFSTNYISVSYCSALCRGTAIERQMGIRWDYSKDHYENLGAEHPLVVGPEAYQVLLEFAQQVIQNHESIVHESSESLGDDESVEEQNPNQSVPDTILEPSLPQLATVSPSGLFGPVPF